MAKRKTPKANARKLAMKLRQQKVLDMRLLGESLRWIGEKLGVSHETVRTDLDLKGDRLDESTQEKKGQMRTLEALRLDFALSAISGQVTEGSLQAVDRWVRIGVERRKMFGIDAPDTSNIHLTGNTLTEMTNDELRAIVAAKSRVDASNNDSGNPDNGDNGDDGE